MVVLDPLTERTRTLNRLQRLEQLTGLRLEIVNLQWSLFPDPGERGTRAPKEPGDEPARAGEADVRPCRLRTMQQFSPKLLERCGESPWAPQFHLEGGVLEFGVAVSFDSAIVGRRRISTSADQGTLRRLFMLASLQLRASEELRQRDLELESLVQHVTCLYEQIHGIFQVSRALSLSEPFETILKKIERSSPVALAADSLCVISVVMDEAGGGERIESSCSESSLPTVDVRKISRRLRQKIGSPIFLSGRELAGTGVGSALAVPLPRREAQSWVVAMRAPSKPAFGSEEAAHLLSLAGMLESHLRNAALYAEKDEMLMHFVRSLVGSLDARDPDTRGHSLRVAAVARILAEDLGLPATDVEQVHTAGLLHDIGKIGISDAVLKKTGPLTDEDWTEIQRHPVIGFSILSGLPQLAEILPGVRSHHERLDGSGYPDGLRGEEIPLMARILAVADGFDAMRSNRVYREGLATEMVGRLLNEGSGSHWDPLVVGAYFACRERIHQEWSRLVE